MIKNKQRSVYRRQTQPLKSEKSTEILAGKMFDMMRKGIAQTFDQ